MMRRIRDDDGNNIYYDPMNGSGWFDLGKKIIGKLTSETAKKLATKAGEKLVEEGSKKIGQKVGEKVAEKIDDLTSKKKKTTNLSGEQIVKSLNGNTNTMSHQFEIDFLAT